MQTHNCNQIIPDTKRNSNLELYRIIIMLLIIIHHYVVNSGLINEVLEPAPFSATSLTMIILGGWGKVGINCFIMITGYFMCKSNIKIEKLLKLYLQIIFYAIIIYAIFCITGHEHFSILKLLLLLFPINGISDSFTSCFLLFYLFIPFLNILLKNLTQKYHLALCLLLLVTFSLLPTIPKFHISFNYVTWFMAVYILAAYIRNYNLFPKITHSRWGWITLGLVLINSLSIIGLEYLRHAGIINLFFPYYFIIDCNKILALLPAISSFMFFKDLQVPHSRIINVLGASTFGVLLIHANSDAMRQWLWRETVDCIGHFGPSFILTIGYSIVSTLIIFIICAGIDWFRQTYIESLYMNYFRRKYTYSCAKIKKNKSNEQ